MSDSFEHTPASREVSAVDPGQWLEVHGDALFRFALLRVGDANQAEDLVQETLLAAIEGQEAFAGKSSVRTWLIGILKNKAADLLRRRMRREGQMLPLAPEEVGPDFNAEGFWQASPLRWQASPADAVESDEFWEVLARCLDALPERARVIFVEREFEARDRAELCELADVSASNLWTLLHRARLALRRCLESNWFRRGDGDV